MRIKREETPPVNDPSYKVFLGYTTELDSLLFDISNTGWGAGYQKSDDRNAFLTFAQDEAVDPRTASLQAVEKLVGHHGPSLLQHFQRSISRSFPIIEDASLSPNQRRTLDPALLCAIYTVSASSPGYLSESAKPHALDIAKLEDTAVSLIGESLIKPTLATIQAGLLLMQRSDTDTKSLNSQLVGAAFELGLHLDCSSWNISEEERGLRKRLAWAVYMTDRWSSLVNGRPSLISKPHWAVQDLYDDDFGIIPRSANESVEEQDRGRDCFCEMIELTKILSSILDTFYTQRAIQEHDAAGEGGTKLILDRAKPIQMRLKEWFTTLPKALKLDGQAPSMIGKCAAPSTSRIAFSTGKLGHLHLAYFATEITLHRCIIRSLVASSTDAYLTHICRSAAKTRLISAMDFVNRLRSDHLTSFWYFASKVNFALIATFGSLLLATAPCQEEADFYRARLAEYRWTLSVSAKNAGFLNFAIESLESSTDLLRSLPPKPKIEELDVRQVPAPPPTINLLPPPIPPTMEEPDEDEIMPDLPFMAGLPILQEEYRHAPPIEPEGPSYGIFVPPSAATEGINFMGGSNAFTFTGPFAGTAFAGLDSRDWFDASHHGSPEAERMMISG